jgi:hypothetical protein
MEMADYTERPLRKESDKEKVLENLEAKVNEIFDFLNDNRERIQKIFNESEVLRSSGIESNLDYVRENIKKLIPRLENHKSDIRIIFNHLEDRLGSFLGAACGTTQRILNGKPFSAELLNGLEKDSAAFARYLQEILEEENFLVDEVQSYQGNLH